ncbi:hypothetical protein AVEN_5427-1, partial [Araneus ventricosus]
HAAYRFSDIVCRQSLDKTNHVCSSGLNVHQAHYGSSVESGVEPTTIGVQSPDYVKPCSDGAWLGRPRVSRGSYLWTVVGGILTSRVVPTERGLANLSASN